MFESSFWVKTEIFAQSDFDLLEFVVKVTDSGFKFSFY